MTKPSKVLIIGSGPIVIGQACCHSEGAERLKNLRKTRPFATLRVTEKGLRVTEKGLRVTEKGLRVTEKGLRVTEKGLRVTEKGLRVTIE